MSHLYIGITLVIIGFSLMPAMDCIAKYLSDDLNLVQIVWGRYFFHFLFLLPIVLHRHGIKALLPPCLKLQIARSTFLILATLTFFAAIKIMPLANALAIAFISPLIVTLISPFFLGEKVDIFRFIAAVTGLMGTLIILRPVINDFHHGIFYALGTGVMYAFYSVTTRKISNVNDPIVTLMFSATVGSIVMSIALPFHWSHIGLIDLGLMQVMGLLGAISHYFFIKAYHYAEASVLAPFHYTEMISAIILSWFIFGDFPDLFTWIGMIIIIGSGILISIKEQHKTQYEKIGPNSS